MTIIECNISSQDSTEMQDVVHIHSDGEQTELELAACTLGLLRYLRDNYPRIYAKVVLDHFDILDGFTVKEDTVS